MKLLCCDATKEFKDVLLYLNADLKYDPLSIQNLDIVGLYQ